jgi:glycosyltransferase involved in cell wall biosynthesis
MRKPKIIIDATSRVFYASFYIKGLQDLYGKRNVSFSGSEFKDLNRKEGAFTFEHYFAFKIIASDTDIKKIVIDFCDSLDVNENAYKWSDVYAKINFNLKLAEDLKLNKIILIPPGFGIKIWNAWETAYYTFSNLAKCRFSPIVSFKRYLQDYYSQFKRPKLNQYKQVAVVNKTNVNTSCFIFLIATLWEENDEKTNLERKLFMELVKSKNCTFEGGFLAAENHPKLNDYKNYTFSNAYSSSEFLAKTQKSNFVFNTPAVHNCHGWKLAEFLAMGKAIISTPLSNDLPIDLEDRKNIHIANNKEELNLAIDLLINDEDYRNNLEKNALSYYEKNVQPFAAIKNLMASVKT